MTEVWGREAVISLLAARGHPQVSPPAFACSEHGVGAPASPTASAASVLCSLLRGLGVRREGGLRVVHGSQPGAGGGGVP